MRSTISAFTKKLFLHAAVLLPVMNVFAQDRPKMQFQPPAEPEPADWENPASGPYKVLMEIEPTLPEHTIYRPSNLEGLSGIRVPCAAH
jgi:hypothetical protein